MKKNKLALVEILRTIVAITTSILIVFSIILLVSDQPLSAISDFLFGPLKSIRRIGNVIEAMVPIIFTGLSVTMLYRAGLFNLSMEGAFFIGSVAATAGALLFDLPPVINIIVAMLFAALAGGLVTSIPAMLKVKCNANELVTSLMLNYVCLYIGLFIITTYFYDPSMNANYSYLFPESMLLKKIIPGTRINTGIIVAMVMVILSWLLLNKTSFGYKVTLVGKNKTMARYSGLNTGMVILGSQLIGGMIAGLGGAIELFGMYKRFQYSGLPGYGWDGVLIAIVARYKAEYVPLSALFLAYLRTGADIMSRSTDIPFEIIKIIQAVVIVLISAQAILKGYRQRLIIKEAKELDATGVLEDE
ncbi:ABC transporter permease [Paratissierella segnis]|uniref:ABC transporter permease n=1 Tax=Paratissierella segnis TaxID=2763679 RepID=A0A926EWM9_9FIRM|nr:ABC transporter permease [Paratissierella segnis]MBC8588951.1 ABC transporter permease [Paratissierella segnis]